MRYVVAWLLGSLCCSPGATPPSVTLVFRFAGPYSEKSVEEMKREVGSIMKGSGLVIDWRERREVATHESFNNLVLVEFHGKCIMEPVPYLYDERGPLAFTYSSDGSILPFSEIECDKVRSVLHTVMWGGDYARSDLLFGRALGRILAHELYHVLAGTPSHAGSGVAKRSLSGSQLISDQLRLNEAELDRLHHPAVE